MKNLTASKIFLIVYFAISVATLYHSSFGFGTLDGLPDNLNGFRLFKWWLLGVLCATSVDVGMGAIVWNMVRGYKSKFLMISLLILAVFSAYSQLIYSSYFAEDMIAKTNNENMRPFMQWILDIRIIILPLCLPFFSLFYGFVAKDSAGVYKDINKESESIPEWVLEEISKSKSKKIVHYKKANSDYILCGINSNNLSTELREDVTCKNCIRIYNINSH